MRRTASAVLVPALVALLVACERPADAPDPPAAPPPTPPTAQAPAAEPPAGATPEMVAQGQQLFEGAGNCYTCHAVDGTGTPLAPNLRDDQWINTDGSFAEIERVIRDGVEAPQQYPAPMPAMGGARLTDEQVRSLAAYVYSISRGG